MALARAQARALATQTTKASVSEGDVCGFREALKGSRPPGFAANHKEWGTIA